MQGERQVQEVYDEGIVLDLSEIARDYFRGLRKYWIQLLLLLLIIINIVISWKNINYSPRYTAKITYAVNKTGNTSVDGDIAARISASVETIVSESEFKNELFQNIKEETRNTNYWITSWNTEETNLFTIAITANNYKNSNLILELLMDIYPQWASRSNGTIELQIVDQSFATNESNNPYSLIKLIIIAFVAALVVCFVILTGYVLNTKTVRKEDDMRHVTSKSCKAIIPNIIAKKRTSNKRLLITDKRVDWGYKQSLLTLGSRVKNQLEREKKQVILISSTLPQEGKSTIAVNLALAFGGQDKKVLIIDGDIRKSSVGQILGFEKNITGFTDFLQGTVTDVFIRHAGKIDVICAGSSYGDLSQMISDEKMCSLFHSLRESYDFIIIDTPPAYLFTDAEILSRYTDIVLYVVHYDLANINEIRDGITPFVQKGNFMGYVLNKNPYSYFTYGTNRYYSKYKRYRKQMKLDEISMDTENTL